MSQLSFSYSERASWARHTDPITSHKSAARVYRLAPQKAAILSAFYSQTREGNGTLTDHEAAIAAGVSMRSCPWKRVGELLTDGLIEQVETRTDPETGNEVRASRITREGWGVYNQWRLKGETR